MLHYITLAQCHQLYSSQLPFIHFMSDCCGHCWFQP